MDLLDGGIKMKSVNRIVSTLIITILLTVFMLTPASAIWLKVGKTKDVFDRTIPILREGWVLHPHVVISRVHHIRESYPDINYYDEIGNLRRLVAFSDMELEDGGGLIAYFSKDPLRVETSLATIMDDLYGKQPIKLRYKIRELFVSIQGDLP